MSANQTNFTATPIPGGFAGVSDDSDLRAFAVRFMQESGAPGCLVRMTTPDSGQDNPTVSTCLVDRDGNILVLHRTTDAPPPANNNN
ncbi:hypothetical protein J7337_009263 [Fusarium musae]|uniref:Uncharacterized protein n=1 Tax=Fusarium musae TaxID=1042133 RepID=A0A9P8IMM6_9HYPO|nr:hypothetical protein J7337_009263 [Fusarium musae]KAG9498458.1 hypothetical protein J7337_009263 [Fusarium musae]